MEPKSVRLLVWLGLALVIAIGLIALSPFLFMSLGMGYGIGYGMMGWGVGWSAVFMIVPFLFFVLILWAVLDAFSPIPDAVVRVPNALETLNARYARGELSQDEYLRIRADLGGVGP